MTLVPDHLSEDPSSADLAVLLDEPAMGWFLGLGGALSYPVGSAMLRIFRGRGNGSRTDQSNDS